MNRFSLALAALLAAGAANAQTVIQSGAWTPGHLPAYYPGPTGSSVPLVVDAGAAGGSGRAAQGISEALFVQPTSPTGPYGTNLCTYDANPATSTVGYHYLCLGANAAGAGGMIAYGAVGAAQLPLLFMVNGSATTIGGSGTIAFPASITGGTPGGIPYFYTANVMSASAALGLYQIVVGGGAGGAPSTTTTGSGILTMLGDNVGSAGAPIAYNGDAGTPSAINLTNGAGLPILTGVSGLGANVAAALGVALDTNGGVVEQSGAITTGHALVWGPGVADGGVAGGLTVGSTAIGGGTTGYIAYDNAGVLGELATTGSGNVVRATSPTLVAPNLGTPSALNLASAIGCPISSCVSGLGTGFATAAGNATNATGGAATLNGNPTVGHVLIWSSAGLQDGGPSLSSGLTVGSTTTSGGAAGQIMFDSGSVLTENAGLGFVSPNLNLTSVAIVSKGTQPTITGSGGTCATGAKAGGSIGGTVTLSGACAASNLLVFTGMPAVPTGYVCDSQDRTQPATLLTETATSTTGLTLTVAGTTSGAADVIQWKCSVAY